MSIPSSDFIRPLKFVENHFLQVLLSRFSLTRSGDGVTLEVQLDEGAPTIWSRHGKRELLDRIPDFAKNARRYQDELDDFLVRGVGERYDFDDASFPFRYASGGTLPIVRWKGREYYCFFYREIHPIGWNIANGGTDSREELLHPMQAADRELREELAMLNPEKRVRYVFEGDMDKPLERPEFAVARTIMQRWFPKHDLASFDTWEVPLKWLDGPDRLVVRRAAAPAETTPGCFLNINAEDFGIEIDRVAWISVEENTVFFDGELVEDERISADLVNCPVGLFDVSKFDLQLAAGQKEFTPDLFFHSAERHVAEGKKGIEEAVFDRYLPSLAKVHTDAEKKDFWEAPLKFDLCPVTRRIVQRHLSSRVESVTGESARPFEVFVSFATEDANLAQEVCNHIRARLGKNVFFSENIEGGEPWVRAINNVLESEACKYLVVVGTNRTNIERRWVDYEYTSFHQLIMGERKPDSSRIIPFVGFDRRTLPLPLAYYDAIAVKPGELESALKELEDALAEES